MQVSDAPADVIAAQFAGGMSIARLALEWELDEEAVETAIRLELRKLIPRWAGGLRPTRDELRKRRMDAGQLQAEQAPLLPMSSEL